MKTSIFCILMVVFFTVGISRMGNAQTQTDANEYYDIVCGWLTIENGIVDDTLSSAWIYTEWYSEKSSVVVGLIAMDIARKFRRWQVYFPEKEVVAIVPFNSGSPVSSTVGILVLYCYRTAEADRPTQSSAAIRGTN